MRTVVVTGKREAKARLRKIANLLSSPHAQTALYQIRSDATNYWAGNVYKHYNTRLSMGKSTSGQLGRGVRVSAKPDWNLDISLKPMYHTTRRGNIYEYSQYLRQDIGASAGAYSPVWDARNIDPVTGFRYGMHPGASNLTTRWNPWMAEFSAHLQGTLRQQLDTVVKMATRY